MQCLSSNEKVYRQTSMSNNMWASSRCKFHLCKWMRQCTILCCCHPPKGFLPAQYFWSCNVLVSFGFFLAVRIWGKGLPICRSMPPLFFFSWSGDKLTHDMLIPLFMPGLVHSGSASGRVFPDKLCVSSLPWEIPTLCLTAKSAHSNFVASRLYARLGVTCHLHFWQNDLGLLHATVVTLGGTDTE